MSRLYRQTCINGHPATLSPDNGNPWRCGDPEGEYFDGADDTAYGQDRDVRPQEAEAESCLTCKGTGRDDTLVPGADMVMRCTDCHGSASKQDDSRPRARRCTSQRGLVAAGSWFHTEGLDTGGSP
jgi:hypothetical protein